MSKKLKDSKGDLGTSVVLFRLATDPVALEVTFSLDQLRQVVRDASPTTDAICFRQRLTPEAGQSLALALLAQPSIGGNMLPSVLEEIVSEKTRQMGSAEMIEFQGHKSLAAKPC